MHDPNALKHPPVAVAEMPARDAYYYETRLADLWLLEKSVAIRTLRMPFLAVPVGGTRRGGYPLPTLAGIGPVVLEHLAWPRRLCDLSAGQELTERDHQVDDGRAGVSVQVGHVYIETVDPQDPREGDSKARGASVIVVSERPGFGPGGVVAGAPGVQSDIVGRTLTEVPDHLQVAELVDALQGFLGEVRLKPDNRLHAALEVVEASRVASNDPPDHRYFDGLVGHKLPLIPLWTTAPQAVPSTINVSAASAYAEHRACLGVEFCSWATSAVTEWGERAAHLDDGLSGPARLHSAHSVECLFPGVACGLELALLDLNGAQVAESYGVSPLELRSPGADAVPELLLRPLQIAEVPQSRGGLVGEAGLAEEPHATGFVVSLSRSAEILLRLEERRQGFLPAVVGGQAARMDDADQGFLTPARVGVPLARERVSGQAHGLSGLLEVDGLVGHRSQNVAGQRRVPGLFGQLRGDGEPAKSYRVLSRVESRPSSEVCELTGSRGHGAADLLGRESAGEVFGDLSAQVRDESRAANATAAALLVAPGEEDCHLPNALHVLSGNGVLRHRFAGAGPFGCFLPPRLGGQAQAGDGVRRADQHSSTVHVHVSAPEVHQRRQRVGAPLWRLRRGAPSGANPMSASVTVRPRPRESVSAKIDGARPLGRVPAIQRAMVDWFVVSSSWAPFSAATARKRATRRV